MKILTDIEIAQKASIQNIKAIADKLNIPEDNLELYGKNKAKIDCSFLNESDYKKGKLILVTAINPTPAGEGKTTTTIGLADALRKIGKNSVVAMREPSLGPVFGVKGGATGGGYAQVVPMEDINLHFTGDFHAIGAANNLLAAMIDNHIYQGNELGIDPERITWKRCVDMNDRQLRVIRDGLGGSTNGVPRSDGYDITVASEIMAVFCLAKSLSDLKTRLARIIIGYNFDGNPVTAGDLGAVGAMAALLKDAIKPNLVQTLEGTPAIIHGGPFANIAHGCNSLIATETALKLADYTVTEAGFGADLGAQKFFDIKCRQSGLAPNAVVLVATVRALKMHGGVEKTKLTEENISALKCGLENLYKHFENITKVYKLPCIVALNHFYNDLESEVGVVKSECLNKQIPLAISKAWELGGVGAIELAEEVVKLCEQDSNFTLCYENSLTIDQKILAVAKRIYGADGIDVLDNAKEQIAKLTDLGFGNLPVCIAKTQYSFSDKPELLGAPKNFNLTIKDIKVSAGAGFIVVLTGNILTMPGLPKEPAAKRIDIDEKGKISGLF